MRGVPAVAKVMTEMIFAGEKSRGDTGIRGGTRSTCGTIFFSFCTGCNVCVLLVHAICADINEDQSMVIGFVHAAKTARRDNCSFISFLALEIVDSGTSKERLKSNTESRCWSSD